MLAMNFFQTLFVIIQNRQTAFTVEWAAWHDRSDINTSRKSKDELQNKSRAVDVYMDLNKSSRDDNLRSFLSIVGVSSSYIYYV